MTRSIRAGRTIAAARSHRAVRAMPVAGLAGLAWIILAGTVLAASPSPTAAAGGDPRSSGQGPGLVGDPVTALVVVAAIALVSLAAALLYVRLTGGPGTRPTG